MGTKKKINRKKNKKRNKTRRKKYRKNCVKFFTKKHKIAKKKALKLCKVMFG